MKSEVRVYRSTKEMLQHLRGQVPKIEPVKASDAEPKKETATKEPAKKETATKETTGDKPKKKAAPKKTAKAKKVDKDEV